MASFSRARVFPRIPSPGSKASKSPRQRGAFGAVAVAMILAALAALLSRKAADHDHSTPGTDSSARILIMTSATGGGHGAAAAAIKHGLEALDPSMGHFDVRVQDMFADHCPWPVSEFPGAYKFLMKNPWMWRAIYYGSQHGTGQLMRAITFFVQPRARQEILDREPDVIVSVHPMMQHIPIKMLSHAGRPPCQPEDVDDGVEANPQPCTPFVTVVTDTETGSCFVYCLGHHGHYSPRHPPYSVTPLPPPSALWALPPCASGTRRGGGVTLYPPAGSLPPLLQCPLSPKTKKRAPGSNLWFPL
ncbi:unnamed protein product [Prorocentrum cordatum]|uniref:Diacylglycerol glucosyltransferase N-terminal domain-containing protein n=1 Tax=Prorocentrum cordatum TaxID=2364126 RepID=A0ABN9VZG6_9DINO|nr:unnamed protein product [Polarella glacialis]